MIACNIETDMKLDARLAATCYSPMLTPSPPPPSDIAAGVKQEKKEKQFPFSVPLVPNEAFAAVKKEPKSD